jgi:uncharacterized membrane protein
MFFKSRSFVLAISILSLFLINLLSETDKALAYETKIGKVISVTESRINDINEQMVEVQLYADKDTQNETIFITNSVPDNQAYAIVAKEGKDYVINYDEDLGKVYISDYYREKTFFTLVGIFFLLVIILGGLKGFNSIISLLLTGIAIIYGLLPGILAGYNPILLAILISAFSTATTMVLIGGFTKKTLAATLGTTGGVAVSGLIAFLVIKLTPLSGLASTEAQILLSNPKVLDLDYQGILAAGILISSLGASMDVSMSIASSTQEIFEANFRQSRSELFMHSMNVGRDIMGTMTDTLILAYTGASIPLFILLSQDSSIRIFNIEIVTTELSSALIGSIGLLLAIPITGLASVFLLKPYK